MPLSMSLTVHDFDFDLPQDLIAQHPTAERGASRLLHIRGNRFCDLRFCDLLAQLDKNDLLVFNDTRVIKARLFGRKPSGGRIELMVERVLSPQSLRAQLRASHPPAPGSQIILDDGTPLTILARDGGFYDAALSGGEDVWALLERVGRLPLPPYITHPPDGTDAERYQTVFAKHPGAVAAPTAGLHFDEAFLQKLHAQGVGHTHLTLHVGAGTFLPVRSDRLDEHRMHHERYHIPAEAAERINTHRAGGGRVVAVGTTSLRALEAAADPDGRLSILEGDTDIFITPGYRFRCVDRLLTNFHLPKSTLLMLVSAFAGMATIRTAYAHAIAARYRFFSYGDAMLLERDDHAV